MKYNSDKNRRRSIRLKGYDYSQAGAYFVTICAKDRECLFGDIVDGTMRLNEYGRIVVKEWLHTRNMRENVIADEFIIMPDHIHGILEITDYCRGTLQRAPTNKITNNP